MKLERVGRTSERQEQSFVCFLDNYMSEELLQVYLKQSEPSTYANLPTRVKVSCLAVGLEFKN